MASRAPPDLATVLAQIAREINSSSTLEETLQMIVEAAARSLPGIDHVGVTIAHRGGGMETLAATDQLVWDLDELQYGLGEGPCVYAIDATPVVRVEHAETETRWPRFMPAAVQRGVRSQLGLKLYAEDETLGGLNMYSTESETISAETAHMAELFATHAALALGRTRQQNEQEGGAGTRQLIDQATGVVMERYNLTQGRAFDYLLRGSSTSNITLRAVAEEIVFRSAESDE